jgi:hypothetical protein
VSGPIFSIRLRSEAERRAIVAAAERAGTSASQWVRALVLEAAGVPTDEPSTAEAGRRVRRGERDPWRTDKS